MTSSTTMQTIIPGNETDHGEWANSYKTQFTYNIDGRQFFYGQDLSSKRWFIQELLPEGKMSASETDNGYWENVYEVQFPFAIGDHQYFYGQSYSSKRWFIQELLPEGKMSASEADNGYWERVYEVQFPFAIGGHQYFSGQSDSSKRWFIQELLPGGKMSVAETDNGYWENVYEVQFPFVINGRQYFYGQNLSSNLRWFIQELLPGGKLSTDETDNGYWKNPNSVQFAYPKLIHGHLYFYGQNLETYNWFVQELLIDSSGKCKMGDEVANGSWKHPYEVQLPYVLGDVAYYYGNNTGGSHNWFIQELISLDQYKITKLPLVYWHVETDGNRTLVQNLQTSPIEAPTYAVGWVPYLADWKNYIKNYGLFSGLRYHDPSEIPGVGVLVGATKGELYGNQMYNQQCESLIPYTPDKGHYSWALVPGGSIMYVWNSQLSLDERNYVRHSDLNEGRPVVCAGEFVFSTFPTRLDGLYIELNDSSGHYKPDGKKCFSFVLDAFKELGIDVSQVQVYARNA